MSPEAPHAHARTASPSAAPSGHDDHLATIVMRAASGLSAAGRRARHRQRDALLLELSHLDQQLLATHQRRVSLLTDLDDLRDELWPRLDHHHARRPTLDGRPQVRPLPARHRYIWGRQLRSCCLAILRRHGRLPLPELHSLLHLYGYGVASNTPVKALADAMGHEVDKGHARRVERGVYELRADFRSRPGRLGDPACLGPQPIHDWTAGADPEPVAGGSGGGFAPLDDADPRRSPDLVARRRPRRPR